MEKDSGSFQLLTTKKAKIRKQKTDADNEEEVSFHVIAAIEGLVTEILVRLPVKSLLRFKSVSDEWLSLITSPHFRDLKSERFSNEISGILLKPFIYSVSFRPEYEFIPVGENYKQDMTQSKSLKSSPFGRSNFLCAQKKLVVQYCQGLLLCRDLHPVPNRDSLEPAENVNSRYYIFNPTTNERIGFFLNRVLPSWELHPVFAVNLAFDPRKSPHYKLICMYRFNKANSPGEYRFELGIYSSEAGGLRHTDVHFESDIDPNSGLYWNGAINWISCKEDGLYFNVDEERLGSLPMPPPLAEYADDYNVHRGRWIRYFGESNGHLHLINMEIPGTEFDVYEMDKGYSGWCKKFHVDLQPVIGPFAESSFEDEDEDDTGSNGHHTHLQSATRLFAESSRGDGDDTGSDGEFSEEHSDDYDFGVLAVVDRDKDDEPFLVLSIPGKAVRFNLKEKSFTNLCDLDGEYGYKDSIQFMESLSRVEYHY